MASQWELQAKDASEQLRAGGHRGIWSPSATLGHVRVAHGIMADEGTAKEIGSDGESENDATKTARTIAGDGEKKRYLFRLQ
jgi:hypothetical protein